MAAEIIQEALDGGLEPHIIFARLKNSGLTNEESRRAMASAKIKFDGLVDPRTTTFSDNQTHYGLGPF